jgi:hypothetical protein
LFVAQTTPQQKKKKHLAPQSPFVTQSVTFLKHKKLTACCVTRVKKI